MTTAMTTATTTATTTGHSGSITDRFDSAFGALVGACADFLAGARQGREIEGHHVWLAGQSTPELARLGLTRADVPHAAPSGTRH